MASLLILCLLLSSAWCIPPLTPPAGGATGEQLVIGDVPLDRVMDSLAGLIRSSFREATATAHAELSSQLAAMSRRLSELSPLSGPSKLVQRVDAMEKVLATLSSRQESVRQALVVVTSKQEEVQQVLASISGRQKAQQTERADIERTLSSISGGLEDAHQSLSSISGKQQNIQQTLSSISSRQENVQQSLSSFSERLEDVQQALSCSTNQLDTSTEVVEVVAPSGAHPTSPSARMLREPCRSDRNCSSSSAVTACGNQDRCGGDGPRLQETCQTDQDCELSTDNAVCNDSLCSCQRGFWNLNNTECRPGAKEGEECLYDQDCSTTLDSLVCACNICAVRTCDAVQSARSFFRLTGGSDCDNGFVQIISGAEKYICDSNWTAMDATVLCRSMGFSRGTPKPGAKLGFDPTNFWLTQDMKCDRPVTSLWHCPWTVGRKDCTASEVASVVCYK